MSVRYYIPVNKHSYEMYSSPLNHFTENYACFIKEMSPIE